MALDSIKIRDFDSCENSKRNRLLVKDLGKENIKRAYAGGKVIFSMPKEGKLVV